ncbi:hypothetical protein I6N96_01910 [Enterococcus sp. BWM-S5]|uniref:DUF3899 domain-containing protein n=1 Tax=Enterococcus larvae TaxID=2794352 RepID=A0ABS4CEH5_9ENTE|nr:hypothetical protein [Enterococcus larvae]MBP1045018.1 hypothetical protein [Enterococcus larvae]
MDIGEIRLFTAAGFVSTGLLLLFALLIKYVTDGLFLSRTPQRFILDSKNPFYSSEKRGGDQFSSWVLHYIPALCLACLILLLFSLLAG